MGFKGILSDSKEGGSGSTRESRRGVLAPKSPRRAGGGSATTTPAGQLVRATSLTLASPSERQGYGAGGLVARLSSPSSSNGRGGLGLSISGNGLAAAGAGGDDGGRGRVGPAEASSSPLSLVSLSPRRVRSSISMGGRRLSAWTLGGGTAAEAAKAADASRVTAEGVERGMYGISHRNSDRVYWPQACCCPAGVRVSSLLIASACVYSGGDYRVRRTPINPTDGRPTSLNRVAFEPSLCASVQTGSDSQSPPSALRLQDGGSGSGDGGFTNLKRSLQQRQRGGGGGSGSPAPSVGPEGSNSSQTRGFRRLTRKLSFRQRQAQANLQASLFFIY